MTHSNVAYQVMWNRLISVVEEQAQALVRTAFSTSVREAGDLSAGVYDPDGQMLAQAVASATTTSLKAMSISLTIRGKALAICTILPWSRRLFIATRLSGFSPVPPILSTSVGAGLGRTRQAFMKKGCRSRS
jgi:hypothetical protein